MRQQNADPLHGLKCANARLSLSTLRSLEAVTLRPNEN
jgi:hypothetical protein